MKQTSKLPSKKLYITAFIVFIIIVSAVVISDRHGSISFDENVIYASDMEYELSETVKYLETLESSVLESRHLVATNHLVSDSKKDVLLSKVSEIDASILALINNYEEMLNKQVSGDETIKQYLLSLILSLEESRNELYSIIDSENIDNRNLLTEKVSVINTLLDNLKAQIETSKEETNTMLKIVQDAAKSDNIALNELYINSFFEFKEGLEIINNSHIFLNSELNELHKIALDTANESNTELLLKITKLETKISEENDSSLSTLLSYIVNLGDNTDDNFLKFLNHVTDNHHNMLFEMNDLHNIALNMADDINTDLIDMLEQMKKTFGEDSSLSLSTLINYMSDYNDEANDNFLKFLNHVTNNHHNMLFEMNDLHNIALNMADDINTDLIDMLEQMKKTFGEDSSLSLSTLINYMSEYNDEANNNYLSLFSKINNDNMSLLLNLSELHAITLNNANENNGQMLNTLNTISDKLLDDSAASLTAINSNIAQLESNLSKHIGDLSGSQSDTNILINQMSSQLSGKLDTLQSTNNSSLTILKDFISGELNSITTLLENKQIALENSINANLKDVFQSVSDGKKFLAAALLTKGQTVAVDATFNDIYNAILAIDQIVQIENMPGKIEFEYHFHIDNSGNLINSGVISTAGGCFKRGVLHAHIGNANSRTGCFVGGAWQSHTHSGCGTRYNYRCAFCNHTWSTDADRGSNCPNGHGDYGYFTGIGYSCGNSPLNSNARATCGKTGLMEYHINCGLNDGQIVKATITYE